MTNRSQTLIPTTAIASATTLYSEAIPIPSEFDYAAFFARFLYGSGGTACKVYIQTSFDDGATWWDIACMAFATTAAAKAVAIQPAVVAAVGSLVEAAITDNTALAGGILGDRVRAKVVITGTYAGASSIFVSLVAKE
jgi:hypothetical protein